MRVIAGEYRGRTLRAPQGRATRPTSDRVREALFSILGDIRGMNAADLFAGSGALGIEALSRGAARVVFVEASWRTAGVIRANLTAVGDPPAAEIRVEDVLRHLSVAGGRVTYDLVFADPPYSSATHLGESLTQLLPGVLHESSVTVTESDKRAPLALDLPLVDERTYGDTRIAIHRGR